MSFATQSLLESGMTRDMFCPMTLASIMPAKVRVFLALLVPHCPHGNMPMVAEKISQGSLPGEHERHIQGDKRKRGWLSHLRS